MHFTDKICIGTVNEHILQAIVVPKYGWRAYLSYYTIEYFVILCFGLRKLDMSLNYTKRFAADMVDIVERKPILKFTISLQGKHSASSFLETWAFSVHNLNRGYRYPF